MYKVEYLPEAITDILDARAYLHEFSPAAANKLAEAIEKRTEALTAFPLLYPVYDFDDSLRLMPLPYQYLCFYYVDEEAKTVKVYRVLRGMRDIPSLL